MDERPTAMRNRVAVLAAVVAFAVGAGAVAVLAGRGGDGDLPKLVYGSTGRDEAVGTRSMAAADMSLLAPVKIEYRLDRPLARPAASAAAYRLAPAGEADAKRLADAVGLPAPTRQDGRWVSSDGKAELYLDEGGGWSYGPGAVGKPDTAVSSSAVAPDPAPPPPAGDSAGIRECPPCPPDQVCTMECGRLVRPEGMPTRAEAEQTARDLWRRAGIDPGPAKLEVNDSYTSMFVSFTPMVDGMQVNGVFLSVTVGPHKAVQAAHGTLLKLDKLGDYPLIDPADAVERLNNPVAYDDGREPAVDLPATGTATATATGQAEPAPTTRPADAGAGAGSSGSSGSGGIPTEPNGGTGGGAPGAPPSQVPPSGEKPQVVDPKPMPLPEGYPSPPPENRTEKVVGVRVTLHYTGLSILPFYVFALESGGDSPPVPAVPDRFLSKRAQ